MDDIMGIVAYGQQIIEKTALMYSSISEYILNFYLTQSRVILDAIHIFFDSTFNFLLFCTICLASSYLLMALIVPWFKKKETPSLAKGNEPLVTIQLPTYNEKVAIECAKRCLEFDYPQDKLQIIIGDDSNDKEVSRLIDAFAKKHQNVQVSRRGSNAGFKPGNLIHMLPQSKGEFIVIFDSDFRPGKDFLRKTLYPIVKDPSLSVVQARWKIYNFHENIYTVLGGSILAVFHRVSMSFISSFGGSGVLCGSAEVVRKKDLIDAGGWQFGSLTEDIECSMRMIKQGRKIHYLKDVYCECETPFTFKDLARQQMRWAYGVISALRQHFFGIMASKKTPFRSKVGVVIFSAGYLFSFMLVGITVAGFLSLISARPAPIDWSIMISETVRNVTLTSGLIAATVIALSLEKRFRAIPQVVLASLSIGLVVTYYVNVGILKAAFGRAMPWFMLRKNGNEV